MKKVLLLLTTIGTLTGVGADWPSFRGENHQGVSIETGLLKLWPEQGPEKVWEYQGIGDGYSSACVVNNEVYTTGMINGEGWIFALTDTGKLKWKKKYGETASEKKLKFKGPRTTPRYDNGLLYIYTAIGKLFCYRADDGDVVWSKEVAKEFGSRNVKWKFTESLLIDGDNVICTPGGEKSLILALDKKTGDVVWNNNELARKSAYCSPTLVNHNGRKLILTNVEKSCVGLEAKTGKLLWEIPLEGKNGQNQVTPLYNNGYVFITNVRGADPTMFKISDDGNSAEVVWKNKILENNFGGVVLHNGYLYGTNKKGWVCQDFMTGEKKWAEKGIREGAVLLADNMLYAYSYSGELALIEPTPEKLNIISQFKLPTSSLKKQNYAHPSISNGKLYVRHGDKMIAFDIAQ